MNAKVHFYEFVHSNLPLIWSFIIIIFYIAPKMPNLKIKTITNRELCCNYEEDYTVKNLKESIEHKEGMPCDQFKLIFSGQQMEESRKLTDYKITPGTFIIMVPSLRGGC